MSRKLKFFFDFGSPASYLAYCELPKIAEQGAASIEWVPVLLGALLKSIGNSGPTDVPTKRAWFWKDMALCAKKRGVPFEVNSFWPINTLVIQRGAVVFKDTLLFRPYLDTVFEAMWAKSKNLNDPSVLAEVLAPIDISLDDFLQCVSVQKVKDELKQNTEEAARLGVFGCPSFLVDDQLFFGQDRLEFVADALRDSRA
ncbi:2-hydroxychromene-2-carboxylate isomerase [Paraburkholderia phytofirmans]|uniref:2-hydroxychromene-2-carboxylate isomerase n=1 Tax=Paraburkholderia phytofirmans OLGA172 TaxID=1417228 RepID=A0A160FWR5_9BURK|nr:2-hydroxychromene-2-carboxylate isomerase [Paraburkholderia phytofirmans]ANB77438.1 disulfide bond formation protein DsbA [Paraburkholderia phytofirmans OLGA172]